MYFKEYIIYGILLYEEIDLNNEEILNITKDAGYHTATSMIRGRANEESGSFVLPRIPINHRTLPHLFLAKILTSYEDKR